MLTSGKENTVAKIKILKTVSYLFNVITTREGSQISSNKGSSREQIQVIEFWGIRGTLEHVQHSLGHQKSALSK